LSKRQHQVVVLGGVSAVEAVGDGEGALGRALLDAGIAAEVAVVQPIGADAHARLQVDGAVGAHVEHGAAVDLVPAVAAAIGLQGVGADAEEDAIGPPVSRDVQGERVGAAQGDALAQGAAIQSLVQMEPFNLRLWPLMPPASFQKKKRPTLGLKPKSRNAVGTIPTL